MKHLIPRILPLLLVAAIPAQQVCVTGIVARVLPQSACSTSVTHQLLCANLRLRSNTIDLDPYVGQAVEVCGQVQVFRCRDMTVTAIRTGVDHMRITGTTNGTVKLGQNVTFTFGTTPLAFYTLLFSGAPGFTPVPGFGQLLLDLPLMVVRSGFLDGAGRATIGVPIPNDPSLVYANAYFQSVFADVVAGTVALRNADCVTILP